MGLKTDVIAVHAVGMIAGVTGVFVTVEGVEGPKEFDEIDDG